MLKKSTRSNDLANTNHKQTYHELFDAKNKHYHHTHHPHLIFYNILKSVLFCIFAMFPILIGVSFYDNLKTFSHPNLSVNNPTISDDDSFSVVQKNGKYQITINLRST
jgi:hypothetical protein